MQVVLVWFLFYLSGFHWAQATVTNEDIRLAILQIVNVVRSTEDKLERHEYRNRVVDEQLKKALINVDKRIKMLDPLKGTVSRLDERLAAIETFLMQKDERERVQMQRTYEAVIDIQKNLPILVEKVKNDILEGIALHEPPAQIIEPTISKKDFEKLNKDVVGKIDSLAATVRKVDGEIVKIKEENKHLNDINNKSSENLEKVKRQLDVSEQILSKYDNKLAEYNNRIPEIPVYNPKEQDEWNQNLLKALDNQKSHVKEILQDVKNVKEKVSDLPKKIDLENVGNATLDKLESLRYDIQLVPNTTFQNLLTPLENINKDLNKTHENLLKNINDISDVTVTLVDRFATNYGKIERDIQALGKVEQVMVQTADSVLDTKRRLEYGVHQILAEIGKKIKENSKAMDEAINERFDNFETSILDEESGALANITSKIGEDIQQVWRQIGIMHQQMSASTDTLNKLQNQTDAYVNGSLDVMDNMKGKVGTITQRMSEVDDNLNYLLGRLSLVTQEFNQIKAGLGNALDEIKESFLAVQEKIKDKGPGPHPIEEVQSQ